MRKFSFVLTVALSITLNAFSDLNRKPGEWVYHGGDLKNSKFLTIAEIFAFKFTIVTANFC